MVEKFSEFGEHIQANNMDLIEKVKAQFHEKAEKMKGKVRRAQEGEEEARI